MSGAEDAIRKCLKNVCCISIKMSAQEELSQVCEEKQLILEEEEKPKKLEQEEEYKWQRVQAITLDTSVFRDKVYQTRAEMQRAVKNGTFNLNKTMAIKNGRLFFLCEK